MRPESRFWNSALLTEDSVEVVLDNLIEVVLVLKTIRSNIFVDVVETIIVLCKDSNFVARDDETIVIWSLPLTNCLIKILVSVGIDTDWWVRASTSYQDGILGW